MFLSSTNVAIANAFHSGTLEMVERPSRFGGSFISLEDEVGVIEVADDLDAAYARINAVTAVAS